MMTIREANKIDFKSIWPIFSEIVSEGTTYAYPRDTSEKKQEKFGWIYQAKLL